MEFHLSAQFDLWASRPEVQAEARAYISALDEELEGLLAKLEKPVMLGRCMNFIVIGAMNELYWHCQKHHQLGGALSRANYNWLATMPEPQWRKVIAVLAYDLGFRFQTPAGRVSVSVPQQLHIRGQS